MLGQAAAMLIPFPATIAAKVRHDALPFAFDQVRPLAGPTIPVLGVDGFGSGVVLVTGSGRWFIVGLVVGGGSASDRGFLTRAVDAPREIRAEAGGGSDRARLQALPTPTPVQRHGQSH